MVAHALDNLPLYFADKLDNIVVVVEDEPSVEDMAALDMDDPLDLLGLYRGVPLIERETLQTDMPDHVILYRNAIVNVCSNRREVIREVRDTLVHELGHHFGLSDEEMPF